VAAVVALGFVGAAPASAHAIISLGGVDAVTGQTSRMTLEVQHGCLSDEDGVLQVLAFVGKPWGRLRPQPVAGWSMKRATLASGGQQITWTKDDGVPQVFNVPVYFPIDVTWPSRPGVVGMTVTQVCAQDTTTWNTPAAPATASTDSPPQTPMPQVKVLPAR
jgi:hypothetical protein